MSTDPQDAAPENPLPQKFTIDLEVGKEQSADLQLRIEALQQRIENVVKAVIIEEGPLLVPILKISSNPEDLKVLGQALLTLVPLFEQLHKYQAYATAFTLAESEPEFFQWAFGDFSDELTALTGNWSPEATPKSTPPKSTPAAPPTESDPPKPYQDL